MGCIYSNFDGICTINHEGLEDNICIFEDDPDPSYGCEDFEDADPKEDSEY